MRILIASVISPRALEELSDRHELVDAVDRTQDELQRLVAGCDALIFRSGVQITSDVMAGSPDLRLVIRAGSGIDNIDLEYVHERGLELVRVPGPGAQAVAEMAFALMLTLARRILVADRLLRRGRWAKHDLPGRLLRGRTLGVYGAGNIGVRVARMGVAWGMRVLACVEHPSEERQARFKEEGIELASPESVLSQADFLSIHLPLTPQTRHLIGSGQMALMKPGAFLVNLSRGGVVDEEAVLSALQSHRLAGAGMDVHEREGEGHISCLADLANVVLTPHVGATTVDTQDEIGRRIVEIIDTHSQG